MTTITRVHIESLSHRLAEIGERAYTRAADGFYDVRQPVAAQAEQTPCLHDLYNLHARSWPSLTPECATQLQDNGFEGYSLLYRGYGTAVFTGHHANGHDYAIRISRKRDERRIVTPLVAQAYFTHTEPGLVMDVTPMMQILHLSDSDVPPAQQKYTLYDGEGEDAQDIREAMEHVLDTTVWQFLKAASCISEDSPIKDIAVLPDGTPVQPDPGQIRYTRQDMQFEPEMVVMALSRFHEIITANQLPEQLQWMDRQGAWKQDRFFANPFNRPAYYQGFRPARLAHG